MVVFPEEGDILSYAIQWFKIRLLVQIKIQWKGKVK